ncbi:glycoside hydrolase family 3 N-terminal domain-containing protein [Herbiconiux sp. KACC 21604]|nr:glycoside hydrolase family 3 protein [Herbiconiux sp. SALV-R1]WPO87650.1 glycoside hydrolase family 3 N-terminal domain-containing protein [Herbiconiux sp. KACC 21604]
MRAAASPAATAGAGSRGQRRAGERRSSRVVTAALVVGAIVAAGAVGVAPGSSAVAATTPPAGSPSSTSGPSATPTRPGWPSPTPSASTAPSEPGRLRAAFPALSAEERIRAYAEVRLNSMTLEQKIASMFMVHVAGSDPAALQGYLEANKPGGLLLLGDNVPGSAADAAALTGALHESDGLATLIAIDQEGGIVARLRDDGYAAADTLKSEPVQATTDAFTQRAALLDATGMTVNFGIVADVTSDPSSFIFERSLGADPSSASARVAAAVSAERGSVVSTLKHFPGHGAAGGDSHTSIPTTDLGYEQWLAEDAPPFQAGVDAGAEMVMFGHLVYSSVDGAPASLSPEWHRVLRDELGFDGVAVTDDLLMLENSGVAAYADRTTNAIAAVAAGNDLLLYNSTVDVPALSAAIASAVRAGTIPESRIDEAALRLLDLRRTLWVAGDR